jgi:bifunctional non-homologous end joining protein LigD
LWLKPEAVAEIEFSEWTEADHLRQAAFVALRDDKDPKEIVKDICVRPPCHTSDATISQSHSIPHEHTGPDRRY